MKLPGTAAGQTHMEVIGNNQLYVVSAGIQPGGGGKCSCGSTALFASSNAGISWKELNSPCGVVGGDEGQHGDVVTADLSSRGTHTLFLLCGGIPGGTTYDPQPKVLFRSKDAGRRWREVSAVNLSNAPPSGRWSALLPEYGDTDLPTQASIFSATRSGELWIALDRGGAWTSRNGGQTWYESLPYPEPGTNGGGLGEIEYVDPLRGWTFGSSAVFSTNDAGRRWMHTVVH